MTDGFREFEQAGWRSAAETYHRWWEQLTRQAVVPLLDAAGVKAGTRLLDVATGPGSIAGAAADRGAAATGLDFAPEMLATARANHPRVTFREGDAEALAEPDAAYDAVTMGFAMLHLARPEQAAAEAFRVLAPGGRYGFTVWATPDLAIGFGIVLEAIRDHGRLDAPLPAGPPFFRFSEASAAHTLLLGAGFDAITVRETAQVWRLPSEDAFFEAFWGGTARTGPLLRAQEPAALARIRIAVTQSLAPYLESAGISVPMPAVLVTGRKPG